MKQQGKWIIIVFVLTFILSITFSTISNVVVANFNNIILYLKVNIINIDLDIYSHRLNLYILLH